MPIIPEKRQLDARAAAGLAAQFWGQPVASARVVAGITAAAPCEPPPLPLAAPSGLSRTQTLVAAHAAGVPLFPAYCEAHGGAVRSGVTRGGLVWCLRPRCMPVPAWCCMSWWRVAYSARLLPPRLAAVPGC